MPSRRTLPALVTAAAVACALGVAPVTSAGATGSGSAATSAGSSSHAQLPDSLPQSVGLDPQPINAAIRAVHGYERAPEDGHPLYPGAVALMGYRGKVVARDASGYAVLYADAETKLPAAQRVPMKTDTIFDLASVSKLFTSLVAVQLIEEGALDLDAPVADYLPEFAAADKGSVTIRMLLTHTSGFPPFLPLWSDYPDPASRIQAVMDAELVDPPGTVYTYSDLNMITLGVVVERLRGKPLDEVVAERITQPLGMADTGYNPQDVERTAATEYQTTPARGMVRGEVHDENAWSLGGVAGHAGVFSTADDLAILCQTILNGGTFRGHRILAPQSVASLITNVNQAFPGDDHGLGFELNQRWYMEGMTAPQTAGHTGYTGTSIVIDTAAKSFAILLTNRVHPSRDWGSINPARRDWAQGLALSQPVTPTTGRTAWQSGLSDATTATLTAPVDVPSSGASLSFDLWLDTEDSDVLTLETSVDGQTWAPLPFAVRDRGATRAEPDGAISGSGVRRWTQARAAVPGGTTALRWRMVTDPDYVGRGVYVDGVLVKAGSRVVLDGERSSSLFVADGWAAARR